MTRPAKRAALLLVSIVTFAVAVGCGGSDQAGAGDAALAFMRAARSPTPALCDIVSVRFLRERTGKTGPAALTSCRATARADARKVDRSIPEDVEVTSVAVDGDTALVRLDARGERTGFLRLVREDGRWKVDGADPP